MLLFEAVSAPRDDVQSTGLTDLLLYGTYASTCRCNLGPTSSGSRSGRLPPTRGPWDIHLIPLPGVCSDNNRGSGLASRFSTPSGDILHPLATQGCIFLRAMPLLGSRLPLPGGRVEPSTPPFSCVRARVQSSASNHRRPSTTRTRFRPQRGRLGSPMCARMPSSNRCPAGGTRPRHGISDPRSTCRSNGPWQSRARWSEIRMVSPQKSPQWTG